MAISDGNGYNKFGEPLGSVCGEPLQSVHLMCTQCVDGCMYINCIAAGAPNYFPNSFAGPEDDLKHANHPQNVRERGRGRGGGGGGGGMGMEEGGEGGGDQGCAQVITSAGRILKSITATFVCFTF